MRQVNPRRKPESLTGSDRKEGRSDVEMAYLSQKQQCEEIGQWISTIEDSILLALPKAEWNSLAHEDVNVESAVSLILGAILANAGDCLSYQYLRSFENQVWRCVVPVIQKNESKIPDGRDRLDVAEKIQQAIFSAKWQADEHPSQRNNWHGL